LVRGRGGKSAVGVGSFLRSALGWASGSQDRWESEMSKILCALVGIWCSTSVSSEQFDTPAPIVDASCFRFEKQALRANDLFGKPSMLERCVRDDGLHGWRATNNFALVPIETPQGIADLEHDDLVKLQEDYDFITNPGCDRFSDNCRAQLDDDIDDADKLQKAVGGIELWKMQHKVTAP